MLVAEEIIHNVKYSYRQVPTESSIQIYVAKDDVKDGLPMLKKHALLSNTAIEAIFQKEPVDDIAEYYKLPYILFCIDGELGYEGKTLGAGESIILREPKKLTASEDALYGFVILFPSNFTKLN